MHISLLQLSTTLLYYSLFTLLISLWLTVALPHLYDAVIYRCLGVGEIKVKHLDESDKKANLAIGL
ncbi:hypothetical protein CFF01_10095 [Shewanella marisflavi]|uniref:Uncharacterized protein n=1 Tax=Shewanella marisflavi TaxID=260364 RepID=A0AAC9U1R3_9GAMM|nr:hypothetical protein CFF01_10095 [Shewanella marisflavi]